MQVDTLRPVSTLQSSTWTAEPSGTIHGVTSDDDDDTWAENPGNANILNLECGSHTPPADHERHRMRARWRSSGDTTGGAQVFTAYGWAISPVGFGPTVTWGHQSTPFPGINPWQSADQDGVPIPAAGAQGVSWICFRVPTIASWFRVHEAYVDIDCRHKPTFQCAIRDGSGNDQNNGTITDTPIPRFAIFNNDHDGLNPRSWRFAIYTLAQTQAGGFEPFTTTPVYEAGGPGVLFYPGFGQPAIALDNGDYVAYFQTFSTIRVDEPFASDIVDVPFEIDFSPPVGPDEINSQVSTDPPEIALGISGNPFPPGTQFDSTADLVIEIQREVCGSPGTWETIHVAPVAEGGGYLGYQFTDRFPHISGNDTKCGEDDQCGNNYRARYWGLVDGILVPSEWKTHGTAPLQNPYPGRAWIKGAVSGALAICPDETWTRTRPFGAHQPIVGGQPTVVTGEPGGRDYQLSFPVTSIADLEVIEEILAQPLVYYQPVLRGDQWMSTQDESVDVMKVGRIHAVSASFVAVNPEPIPDPASFFPDA